MTAKSPRPPNNVAKLLSQLLKRAWQGEFESIAIMAVTKDRELVDEFAGPISADIPSYVFLCESLKNELLNPTDE